MKEFDEIPFVPCNDCTSWESCTQDAYEEGKAEAKAEHDKECDRCQYSLRKETIEEVRKEAITTVIDLIEDIHIKTYYCIEDECDDSKSCDVCLYEAIKKNLEHLKEQKE